MTRRMTPLRRAREFLMGRFTEDASTGCWNWTAGYSANGYGAIRHDGRARNAHRATFEVANGVQLDRTTYVLHRCDNPRCVNPDHLFAGSQKDNLRDCAAKGRLKTPVQNGERNPASKLTREQALQIRNDSRSLTEIAREFGLSRGTVYGIKARKTWRWIE